MMIVAVAIALTVVVALIYLHIRNSKKTEHASDESFGGKDSGLLVADNQAIGSDLDEFDDEYLIEKNYFSAGAWGVSGPVSFDSEGYDIVESEPHALPVTQQSEQITMAEASVGLNRAHGAIAPTVVGSTEAYYISDIHICHQIDFAGCDVTEATNLLRPKVEELVASLPHKHRGIILIAGDVADSPSRALLFYSLLVQTLQTRGLFLWRIAVTLGNHELWNGAYTKLAPPQSLDDLVATYREGLRSLGICLLENDLLAIDERGRGRLVRSKDILRMSHDRLTSICRQSSALILGGIGFGGLNQEFNSVNEYIYGLWLQTDNQELHPNITREEEIARSETLCHVHDKLFDACSGRPVVVLTHHPPRDWLSSEQIPGWFYVHGHSHLPEFRNEEGRAAILGDNQMGYTPKPWSFKDFWLPAKRITSGVRYDPFAGYEDGIHRITAKQYEDFNRGRGIKCEARKRLMEGKIFLLKKGELYMFLLERKKLCILDGGRLRSARHEPSYYLENMVQYATVVDETFTTYFQILQQLSIEVRKIGGDGRAHGSIIDVDFTRHISFDPFDQRLKLYEATMEQGKSERTVYNDQAAFFDLLGLRDSYEKLISKGELPLLAAAAEQFALLSSGATNQENALANVKSASYLEVSTEMYQNSDRLKTIQYMVSQNVIRIWNEKVLEPDKKKLDSTRKRKQALKAGQSKLTAKKEATTSQTSGVCKPKKTLEERAQLYATKVMERSGGAIEVDCASYAGGKGNVAARCMNCGHDWLIRADHLLSRCYCPLCKSGSGANSSRI